LKSRDSRIDVLHLTTSHKAEDNRIYFCEAHTLSQNYSVVVMGLNPRKEPPLQVPMWEVPAGNLIKRLWFAFQSSISIRPKVVHIHDPEMILTGILLRLLGMKIVYDIHEDYERKFQSNKNYPKFICKAWWFFEKTASRFFQGVITADSHIARKFDFHRNVIVIGNFPPLSFVNSNPHIERLEANKTFKVCYVGTIHEHRGVGVAVDAIDKVKPDFNVELHVVGDCRYPHLFEKFKMSDRTVYHGRIPWDDLSKEMLNFHLGLALFQPVSAFTYYPGENIVKLFEYAGLGMPYLISDFDPLKKFVFENGGGLNVNPTNSTEIASRIEELILDKKRYEKLSQEGVSMVRERFNWESQEDKLLSFYNKILS